MKDLRCLQEFTRHNTNCVWPQNSAFLPASKLKHQRLDGDGDGAGGFQNFAEVDEVEVVERDAVDGEDVVFEVAIVLEDVAHQSREVVVEDEIDRAAAL